MNLPPPSAHKRFRPLSLMIALTLLLGVVGVAAAADSGITTYILSRNPNGGHISNFRSEWPSSVYVWDPTSTEYTNGRFLTFSSKAINLIGNRSAVESPCGNLVSNPAQEYVSTASNCVGYTNPTSTNQQYDIFVLNRDVNADGLFDYNDSDYEMMLVSTDDADTPSHDAASESVYSVFSRDGNYLVFQSTANYYCRFGSCNDNNGKTDIYLLDFRYFREHRSELQESYEIASRRNNGDLTTTGHSGNTNTAGLIRPLARYDYPGAVVYSGEERPNNDDPWFKAFVIFESVASDLTSDTVTEGVRNLYIRDVDGGTTTLLTKAHDGSAADGDSFHPVVSQDGCALAFVSAATNLINGVNTNGVQQVYLLQSTPGSGREYCNVADLQAGTLTLISRHWNVPSGQSNCGWSYLSTCEVGDPGDANSNYPAISNRLEPEDNYFVAFQSEASLLPAGADNNAMQDVYEYEADKHGLKLISARSPATPGGVGEPGNRKSLFPSITANGNVVAFSSYATNLVEGDDKTTCPVTLEVPDGNCQDAFAHEWRYGQTWRVSLTKDGQQGDGLTTFAAMNGDGRYVIFSSDAYLSEQGNNNGVRQIYTRDQGTPPGNPNLQPTMWDFRVVGVNQTVTKTFTVSALGGLEINDFNVVGDDASRFSVTNDQCTTRVPKRLNAGDQCTFVVSFTPTGSDVYSAKIEMALYRPEEYAAQQNAVLEIFLTGSGPGIYFPMVAK